MDPFLRGFSEQFIDVHLEEEEIRNMKAIVNMFGMGLKSKLDASVGFFLGYSYAELLMQFLILRNRLPNKNETKEFFDLIKRRYPEILKEIKREKKSMFHERNDEVISVSELELDHIESESK